MGTITAIAGTYGINEMIKSDLDYRYVYVLEEPYEYNGKIVTGLSINNTDGKILKAHDFIYGVNRPYSWKGQAFDPDLDLVLKNYKGIANCIAYGV